MATMTAYLFRLLSDARNWTLGSPGAPDLDFCATRHTRLAAGPGNVSHLGKEESLLQDLGGACRIAFRRRSTTWLKRGSGAGLVCSCCRGL